RRDGPDHARGRTTVAPPAKSGSMGSPWPGERSSGCARSPAASAAGRGRRLPGTRRRRPGSRRRCSPGPAGPSRTPGRGHGRADAHAPPPGPAGRLDGPRGPGGAARPGADLRRAPDEGARRPLHQRVLRLPVSAGRPAPAARAPQGASMARLQIGFIPIEGGHYYREALEEVARAEELGFDSAWMEEHHAVTDHYWPSPLPVLAGFATRTTRLRLGTDILVAA